ncbi:MAG: hypothetical protein WAU17_06710 [Nitrospirales bacterium]
MQTISQFPVGQFTYIAVAGIEGNKIQTDSVGEQFSLKPKAEDLERARI